MQTVIGQTKQDKYFDGTYDGLNIIVNLVHTTAATAIAASDFNPESVNVKVTLKRDGATYQPLADNLRLLALANTFENGYHEFDKGVDIISPAAGKYAQKQRSVFLKFMSPIRLGANDQMIVEIQPSAVGTVSANIDLTKTYIDFNLNPCVGYEEGIYETVCEVVQAGATSHNQTLGSNVVKAVFLNLNKTDLETPVIKNVGISSDKFDTSLTFEQLLAQQTRYYSNSRLRLGTSLPLSDSSETVYRGLNYLPQSFILFDFSKHAHLDTARLNILLDGGQVAASSNFVVYWKYTLSKEALNDSLERQAKHQAENISKLPLTTN